MHYTVKFYNDMGHLLIDNYDNIPQHISSFAYSKVKTYINYATDKGGRGCRFYVLKAGLSPKYTYYIGNDTVEIDWSDCKYNGNTMMYLPSN